MGNALDGLHNDLCKVIFKSKYSKLSHPSRFLQAVRYIGQCLFPFWMIWDLFCKDLFIVSIAIVCFNKAGVLRWSDPIPNPLHFSVRLRDNNANCYAEVFVFLSIRINFLTEWKGSNCPSVFPKLTSWESGFMLLSRALVKIERKQPWPKFELHSLTSFSISVTTMPLCNNNKIPVIKKI